MKLRKTYIELTTLCNLSCAFCGGTSRGPRFMEPALFDRILEQIKDTSRHLYFHVMGEPLLHPQVADFIDRCEPFGYKVHLVTNGRLLKDAVPLLVNKPALRQVALSLHSLEHTLSDEEIDAFLAPARGMAAGAAARENLWVTLRLWNKGIEDPAQEETNGRILQSIQRVWNLPHPPAQAADAEVPISPHLSLEFAPRFDWPDPSKPDLGNAGTCHGLRDQCAILADGTVVPCCLDRDGHMPLGSVAEKPLKEILQSDRATRIRQGFARREVLEDLCRRCTYRLRFAPPR